MSQGHTSVYGLTILMTVFFQRVTMCLCDLACPRSSKGQSAGLLSLIWPFDSARGHFS